MNIWAAIQRLETLVAQAGELARRSASGAAALVGITRIQVGTATLIGGTVTVVTANITASSIIVAQFRQFVGGTGAAPPFTVRLEIPVRVVGAPGSFEISALTNNGVLSATDTSSVDWIVIN